MSNLFQRPGVAARPNLREKIKDVFESEDTYATVLLAAVLDQYGQEALEWHPFTLRLELEQDFGAKLPKINLDKLMSAIAVTTTDLPYITPDRFIVVCNSLSGEEYDPETFDPADVFEIAWGLTEMRIIDPPADDTPEFSPEVVAYISYILRESGVTEPPAIMRFAVDPRAVETVGGNLSDDPDMFSAYMSRQESLNAEVAEMLRDNTEELQGQLSALPLKSQSAAELFEEIKRES